MASGLLKKTMVYLGLVDDEYDEADGYEPWAPPATRQVARVVTEEPEEQPATVSPGATIRPLTRDELGSTMPATVAPLRSAVVKPLPADSRPGSKVHVVAPKEFTDGKTIADRLVSSQPVIVNLQLADRDLMRRIIDFCSGVAYAIGGKMERVADKVFLVTPPNVTVPPEERQRLQENGLVRV
jgi:cell division inhibitor SepF